MVSIYDVKNVLSIQVTLNFNKLKVKVNFKFSLIFQLKNHSFADFDDVSGPSPGRSPFGGLATFTRRSVHYFVL